MTKAIIIMQGLIITEMARTRYGMQYDQYFMKAARIENDEGRCLRNQLTQN